MTIQYTITLLSEWHVNSGLTGGASVDNIMLKDSDKLPYIPGKTIKGLLRDALEEMNKVQEEKFSIEELMGKDKDSTGTESFFTNATLSQTERKDLVNNNLQGYLYRNIASTKIEEKTGIAQDKSLRAMEVCMPLTLHGEIHYIKDEKQKNALENALENAMKWTRRLGMKRSRGYGRCQIKITNPKSE